MKKTQTDTSTPAPRDAEPRKSTDNPAMKVHSKLRAGRSGLPGLYPTPGTTDGF